MRAQLIVLFVAGTALAHASDALRVDGVPTYGRVRDVERIDIRQAIKAGAAHGSVFKAEVLGPADIKVYLRNLGFIQLGRYAGIQPDGTRSHEWSWSHPAMWEPEVLDLIKTADEVYVFPLTTPLNPHRSDKHMRLLVGQARRDIVRLLGRQRNWYVGHYTILGDPRARIGLIFRRGPSELALSFSDWGASEEETIYAEGTFNGHYVADMLEQEPAKLLGKWAQRYAQAELATK